MYIITGFRPRDSGKELYNRGQTTDRVKNLVTGFRPRERGKTRQDKTRQGEACIILKLLTIINLREFSTPSFPQGLATLLYDDVQER